MAGCYWYGTGTDTCNIGTVLPASAFRITFTILRLFWRLIQIMDVQRRNDRDPVHHIGAWMRITKFMVFGMAQFNSWNDARKCGFILSLVISTHYGMLLTQNRGIPLWSSSILPLLSFFIALGTGLGLLLLISPAYVGLYGGTELLKALGILGIVGIALIVGELISIWSLMGIRSGAVYIESIRRLRIPTVANVVCLFLALLLLLGLGIGEVIYPVWALSISGLLLLVGGFITRYAVLKAGYYLPLRVPLSRLL